jgi:hypothetical protein
MWSRITFFFVIASALACVAQQSATPATPAIDNDFVQKQFGSEFTLVSSIAPLTGDFDGDGVPDLAFITRAKNPMIDEAEHKYKVLDPYDDFFGIGDPKITSHFGSEDPDRRGLVLCIVHGADTESMRTGDFKAKFVVINLPFKQLTVKRINIHKKLVTAIYAEETSGDQMTSVIFFDGKKYKYQPMGSSME